MIEVSTELCTLYVYHNDERRLLYICESAAFPVREFNEDDWRVVMRGVEPPPSGEASLNRCAYYPAWLPKHPRRFASA